MAAAKKGFEFFLKRLLKGFRSVEKREPNNLEMILIKQEARNKAIDANKVIDVKFGKPFNEEIEAMIKSGDVKVGKAPKTPPYEKSQADIEFEIMEKIKSDNEKAIKAFESRNPNPKKILDDRTNKIIKNQNDDIEANKQFKETQKILKEQMDILNDTPKKASIEGQMEKINKASNRIDELIKEREAMYKPKKTDDEIVQDLVDEKFGKGYFDTVEKPKKAGKGQFTKAEYLIQRLRNTIKDNPDDKYVQEKFPGFIKEIEANPDLAKNENVFKELGGDLPDNQKITVYDDDTLDFATLQPTKKFKLNVEKFKKDFNVADDEIERITKLSSEDQQKVLREYIDKDFGQQIELSDFDVTDLEPNAEGGRAGYYTGGMIDVEPNLSDIGHGSDSLMARTRLVSPNNQATTSTGLNYLLAEDNDNIRVPFGNGYGVKDHQAYVKEVESELHAHFKKYKKMGGKMKFNQYAPKFRKENYAEGGRIGFSAGGGGRRAFLKLLAALGGTTAAVKSGIIGLGEGVGKKAVTETIKKSAGSSTPPPYFFELMETITKNGREIKSYGDRVKQTIAPSKDGKSELLLTEDLNTGSMQIKKIYKENDNMVTKSEEMTYTKGQADESTKGKPADDYEEVTEFNSRIYKDEFNDPDVIEGIDVESIIKEVDVKKASGGIAQMIGE